MASWLVRLSSDGAIQIQSLAVDIATVLGSWKRHCTLIASLSTQVYKWVPAHLMLEGYPVADYHPIQGEVEILLPLCVTETRISSGLMGHLAHMQTLPYTHTYI